jgi:hypothetical protein
MSASRTGPGESIANRCFGLHPTATDTRMTLGRHLDFVENGHIGYGPVRCF